MVARKKSTNTNRGSVTAAPAAPQPDPGAPVTAAQAAKLAREAGLIVFSREDLTPAIRQFEELEESLVEDLATSIKELEQAEAVSFQLRQQVRSTNLRLRILKAIEL